MIYGGSYGKNILERCGARKGETYLGEIQQQWRQDNEGRDRGSVGCIIFLCGVQNYEEYGIDLPEPCDTKKGLLAEKATLLNATGKEELTTAEVAEILGISRVGYASAYYKPIAKHFDVPKMISERDRKETGGVSYKIRNSFYETQSEGLQVMSKKELENGKAIYQLR